MVGRNGQKATGLGIYFETRDARLVERYAGPSAVSQYELRFAASAKVKGRGHTNDMSPKKFTVNVPIPQDVYKALKRSASSQGKKQEDPRLCVEGQLSLIVRDSIEGDELEVPV